MLFRSTYIVHGMVSASELQFPELAPVTDELHLAPDVTARLGRLCSKHKAVKTDIADLYVTEEGNLRLVVPGAAQFEVRDGTEVTIEVDEHPDMTLLRLYFFGSVMGLICHPSGRL